MKMWDCNPISNVFELEPSIECLSDRHTPLLLIGLSSFVVYGFGTIIVFGKIFLSNRAKMKANLLLWKRGHNVIAREEEIFKKFG